MGDVTRRTVMTVVACAGASGALAADPKEAAVDRAVQDAMMAGDVPGAVVAVRRNGERTYLKAHGRAGPGDAPALTTDAVIWIASMTKTVVAATCMMMVDAGRIKLDDPIGKYIPAFAAKPRMVRTPKPGQSWPVMQPGVPPGQGPKVEYDLRPAKRDLTIRDVLTQTSGLQTIGIPNPAIPDVGPKETVAEWTAKLADAPLDFEPGSRFGYSNATAFELGVRAVEVASGRGYADFMRERFFGPLDMPDSSFGPRADLKARTAPGYATNNQISNGIFTSGSAGMFTTAEDYSHFQQMLLGRGQYRGRRLLSANAVRTMMSNQVGAVGFPGIDAQGYAGRTDRVTPGLKLGLGGLVVTDAAAAGLSPLPNGSFGWDGVGTRRHWVIPARNTTITMLIPGQLKPAGATRLHRAIELAVLA
jgi:CubicO group peptidase (beta-lactamase class C family)